MITIDATEESKALATAMQRAERFDSIVFDHLRDGSWKATLTAHAGWTATGQHEHLFFALLNALAYAEEVRS